MTLTPISELEKLIKNSSRIMKMGCTCDTTITCEPTGMCRMHTLELPVGDPRLGPALRFFPIPIRPGEFPKRFGKLFCVTTGKDGYDQVSEVPEDFYAPDVPIEMPGQTQVALESQECM
jgi:hypothetical protein